MGQLPGIEKHKRFECLKKLREGALNESDPIGHLTALACEYGDQTVQKAAVTGLSKHANNPKALLGMAMRLLDSWGCGTINHIIGILPKLADHGGLILLGSTLFYDNRFIYDKVTAIKKALEKCGDKRTLLRMEMLDHMGNLFQDPKSVNEWMKVLVDLSNLDVREGAIFGSQYEGIVGWQAKALVKRPSIEVSRATNYVESRIPGLEDLYKGKMPRKAEDVK